MQQSEDGVIHGATVKIITKTGKVNKLRRPVQRLFPLEVLDKPAPDESDKQELEVKLELQRRLRRVAAQNADFFRRLVDSLIYQTDVNMSQRGECRRNWSYGAMICVY